LDYRSARKALLLEKSTLKQEKERLQRSRSGYWIEPAKEMVNALETLGKAETANDFPAIAGLVQKIGTNLSIARKTVTFSLTPLYDFVPYLVRPEQFRVVKRVWI